MKHNYNEVSDNEAQRFNATNTKAHHWTCLNSIQSSSHQNLFL